MPEQLGISQSTPQGPQEIEDIVWEDPPPKHNARVSVLDRFVALKENPGRWAVIYEGTKSGAANAHAAVKRAAAARSERWEACTRQMSNGLSRAYARYMNGSRS